MGFCMAKDMRMAANQLVRDSTRNRVEIEALLFLSELGMLPSVRSVNSGLPIGAEFSMFADGSLDELAAAARGRRPEAIADEFGE